MDLNIVAKSKERYLEHEHRHKKILAAAMKVFNCRGYKGATTAAIAKEADISEHTMYQHFATKKALFLECHNVIIAQLMSSYRQVYKNNQDDEIGYLRGVEKVYRDFVLQNPDKSMFFFQMFSYRTDPEIGAAINEYLERSIEAVQRMVASGKKKGRIKSKVSDRALASFFIGAYFTTFFMKTYVDLKELAEAYPIHMNDMFGFEEDGAV